MPVEWANAIPDTVTIDQDGAQVPLRNHPMVQESPDLGHFVKRSYDQRRELDSRIPIKIDSSKPEEVTKWQQEHLPKLQKAGLIYTPPSKPEEYEIKRPEGIPEKMGWSDELSGELAKTLHKHGANKAMVPELLELHKKSVLNAQAMYKVSEEEAITALKKEFGAEYEPRQEQAKRFLPEILSRPGDAEFLRDTGLGNHPTLLSIIMRLAPAIQSQSSVIAEATKGGGGKPVLSREKVQEEVNDIATNPQNPKNAGYKRSSKEVMDYIDELYRQLPQGAEKLTIS